MLDRKKSRTLLCSALAALGTAMAIPGGASAHNPSGHWGGVLGAAGGAAIVVGRGMQQGQPPILQPTLLLGAPLAGLTVGFLAGVLPALRAARIEPSEAVRA